MKNSTFKLIVLIIVAALFAFYGNSPWLVIPAYLAVITAVVLLCIKSPDYSVEDAESSFFHGPDWLFEENCISNHGKAWWQ